MGTYRIYEPIFLNKKKLVVMVVMELSYVVIYTFIKVFHFVWWTTNVVRSTILEHIRSGMRYILRFVRRICNADSIDELCYS